MTNDIETRSKRKMEKKIVEDSSYLEAIAREMKQIVARERERIGN